jgi:hypothetical protein
MGEGVLLNRYSENWVLYSGQWAKPLSARNGQSGRSSNFQVCLLCFLGSGHWIGGTLFSRLIGSNAAIPVRQNK